ncbi:MAG TPA: alpha/beta fold hydrolase [Longimicrobiaceae bacterium]
MARRAWTAAGIALLAAGCAGRPAPDAEGWVVTHGADTVLVERVAAGDPVEGEMRIGEVARVRWTLREGSGGARLEAALAPAGAPAGPAPLRLAAAVSGGTARAELRRGAETRVREARAAPGTLPYLGPSVALLERALRSPAARRGGGVRLLLLPAGAPVRVAVERLGRDSVRLTVEGNEWRLATDAEGRVLGGRNATRGWTVRRVAELPEAALSLPPPRLAPPPGDPYGPPAGAPYAAREARVPAPGGHVLAGTLTLPHGARRPAPAVLLLSGSSPQDRDGSGGASPYRPFREIADTLGRLGIAVLRLDDRGVGASTGRFEGSTFGERADDARAALAWLRAQREVDPERVALVGWSEGGAVAALLAAGDARLRGVALLASPGDSGRAVARYQTRARVEADPAVAPAVRDSAAAAQLREWEARAARDPWIASFLRHDPVAAARRVRAPALVLHGARDRSVDPADARRLGAALRAAGNPDVTVRLLPGIAHSLLRDPDGAPGREMYLYRTRVAPEVTGALTGWLVARLDPAIPGRPGR